MQLVNCLTDGIDCQESDSPSARRIQLKRRLALIGAQPASRVVVTISLAGSATTQTPVASPASSARRGANTATTGFAQALDVAGLGRSGSSLPTSLLEGAQIHASARRGGKNGKPQPRAVEKSASAEVIMPGPVRAALPLWTQLFSPATDSQLGSPQSSLNEAGRLSKAAPAKNEVALPAEASMNREDTKGAATGHALAPQPLISPEEGSDALPGTPNQLGIETPQLAPTGEPAFAGRTQPDRGAAPSPGPSQPWPSAIPALSPDPLSRIAETDGAAAGEPLHAGIDSSRISYGQTSEDLKTPLEAAAPPFNPADAQQLSHPQPKTTAIPARDIPLWVSQPDARGAREFSREAGGYRQSEIGSQQQPVLSTQEAQFPSEAPGAAPVVRVEARQPGIAPAADAESAPASSHKAALGTPRVASVGELAFAVRMRPDSLPSAAPAVSTRPWQHDHADPAQGFSGKAAESADAVLVRPITAGTASVPASFGQTSENSGSPSLQPEAASAPLPAEPACFSADPA